MTTRAVGYIRASTSDQTITLDAQRVRIEAYAVAMGIELVAVLVDAGVSGKSLARPELARALAMLESGAADALLVTKLDRLTRCVADLGELVERYFASRFALLSVGDSIDTRTASGRLILNVLASVAQWEREAIAERTREALAQVKREGGHVGRVGLGKRRTGAKDAAGRQEVVEDATGAATLARARALREAGLSFAAVATRLAAEGHATSRGGRWASETVRKALRGQVAA